MSKQQHHKQTVYSLFSALLLVGAAGCQTPFAGNELREDTVSVLKPALSGDLQRLPAPDLPPEPVMVQTVMPVAYQDDTESTEIQTVEEVPVPTPAHANGLTLEQLEQMGLDANPAIMAACARVQALRGRWTQVGLAPNPTIGYIAEEIGDDNTAGKQGAFAGQQFVTGGKLGLSRAVVAQEIAKAEQVWAGVRQRVLTDIRTGYYDVLIAQRRLDVTRELVRVSERAVEASTALVAAQEVSEVALLQTEVEAENAQILARQAWNENEAAWRRLSSALGRPELATQRLAGELGDDAVSMTWEEELQRLVTKSPEIATAVAELERSRRALDRAYAQVVPNVNVQVGVQYDNATGDTVTGVQVGVPIPLWNRNQGGIQQARREVCVAQKDMQRIELKLREQLATAFQEYQDSHFQVTKYADTILPKAKRTFELVSNGYQQGEVGYLDMLAGQRTYFQTNLAYVESLRKYWNSRLQIDGLLLDGSLSN